MAELHNVLNYISSGRQVENGIWLTCQICGNSKKWNVAHATSDKEVVSYFRSQGWSCTNKGMKAKCPVCRKQ